METAERMSRRTTKQFPSIKVVVPYRSLTRGDPSMSEDRTQNRRRFLGTTTAAVAAAQFGALAQAEPTEKPLAKDTIRPFRIDVPDADLTDLRKRIKATRWPER